MDEEEIKHYREWYFSTRNDATEESFQEFLKSNGETIHIRMSYARNENSGRCPLINKHREI